MPRGINEAQVQDSTVSWAARSESLAHRHSCRICFLETDTGPRSGSRWEAYYSSSAVVMDPKTLPKSVEPFGLLPLGILNSNSNYLFWSLGSEARAA